MTRLRLVVLGAAAVALAATALLTLRASSSRTSRAATTPEVTIDDFSTGARAWKRIGPAKTRTHRGRDDYVLTLSRGGLSRRLPAGWSASFDLRLSRGARVSVGLGRAGSLQLRNGWRTLTADGGRQVHRTLGVGGWYRVEATTTSPGAAVDGQRLPTKRRQPTGRLTISVSSGRAELRALVAGPASSAAAGLLQRLAWLHTRTPARSAPLGMGLDGRLRFSTGWTSGFWPGALWQAFEMTHNDMFKRWALRATLDNFGRERSDTHDLGFMYELSSVEAYTQLCTATPAAAGCDALRKSALSAADSLMRLAGTNTAAGTIPTRSKTLCQGCTSLSQADTIVDSVMNLPLLFWASKVTGDSRYRDVAARHAQTVAARMVRQDGSTWSSMHTKRRDGSLIRYHTHQGYRDNTTWSRGQAWAIYGIATAAGELSDTQLLATAQRTARYVMARTPRPALPLYDYDAPADTPRDASAAIITVDGLLRLADACEQLSATCDPSPALARRYAHGLLTASLAGAGRRPPLGLLGHQVYSFGGTRKWSDDAELIFGLHYALEALNRGGAQ